MTMHGVPDASLLATWLQGMAACEAGQKVMRMRATMRWLEEHISCDDKYRDPALLASLLRLLRGAPAFGPEAVDALLAAGAPQALARLAPLLLCPQGPPSSKPIAAQAPAQDGSQTITLYPPSSSERAHEAYSELPLRNGIDGRTQQQQQQQQQQPVQKVQQEHQQEQQHKMQQQNPSSCPCTPPGNDVLLPTILSQAVGNLAMSGLEGADKIWRSCFPCAFHLLLSHPSPKVWEPCAMALYACCRANAAHSLELCQADPREPPLWALMLGRTVAKTSPAAAPLGQRHEPGDVVCCQWVQLLVGLVTFKQGLLQELLRCLPLQEASLYHSSTCQGPFPPVQLSRQDHCPSSLQDFSWGHHTPVLLHILAHEVESMVRGAEGDSDNGNSNSNKNNSNNNNNSSHDDCGSNISSGDGSESLPPWQRTLQCIMAVVLCAARQCAAPAAKESSKQTAGLQLAAAGSSREVVLAAPGSTTAAAAAGVDGDNAVTAGQGTDTREEEKRDRGTAADAQRSLGSGDDAASLLLPDQQLLAKHVLEAGLEVLKCFAQREDRGLGLCGGRDPVIYLCQAHHLVLHLLGMLHTLQPVQNPGRNAAAVAAAATAQQQRQNQQASPTSTSTYTCATKSCAQDVPLQQQQQHQQQQEQQGTTEASAEAPRYTQPAYTRAVPVVPPYLGYRGDLLAVLANAICNRPAVAEEVAMEAGAVELVLGQCQLDDLSPLAREWGLWAVRNLCAGSVTAQERIKQLEPVEPVESPELRALGMRLEMDNKTGKLKVVRNNETPQFN